METLDLENNSLFNLINQQPDIDKIYLYAKGPYDTKYKFLINEKERTGLNHFSDSKAFIEYSDYMIFIKTMKTTIKIWNIIY